MTSTLLGGVSISCIVTAMFAASPATAQAVPEAVSTPAQDSPVSPADPTPGPVQANQTPGSPLSPTESSNDIIVTAQRRGERLSRVGVSVAAVTSDQLRLFGVQSTQDLARVVPGFQAGLAASSGAPNYYLRGVGFNTQNANSTAPVGVYVDEVAYAYPYMTLAEAFDLERVEVLKGPQGTFYGRNTTGGLVDFVTAKPTDTFRGSLTGAGGNFGEYDFSGFLSGPLGDTLKARIAFDSQNRGTWQQSITRNDRLGRLHQNAGRLILDWEPTSKLHFVLSGNGWKKTGDTQAPQAIASIVANPGALVTASLLPNPKNNTQADWTPDYDQPQTNLTGIVRPPLRVDADFYAVALRSSLELAEGVSLVSLTGYNHLRHHEVVDSAGVQVEQVVQGNDGRIKSFSEELRLVGTSDRFNWSIGGYYAKDTTLESTLGYAGELPTITGLRAFALSIPQTRYTVAQINTSFREYGSYGNTKDRVAALFGNAEYALNDKFKVALGGRYTEDKLDFIGSGVDTNGNNIPLVNIVFPLFTGTPLNLTQNGSLSLNEANTGFATAIQSQKQHNFSWRANVSYTPTSQLLFYGTISRGYKSGSFPVLAASTVTQLAPVTQEQLTAYEVGAKLSNGPVQLNASAFYYDYVNRQIYGHVADLIFTSLPRIVNVPKSRSYGFEADMTVRIDPTLTLRLSGAYLDSKITRYTGYNDLGVVQNFDDTVAPFAPKFQGQGSINKDVPLNDTLTLELAADGTYQTKSNSFIGELPLFQIDSYALFGASVSLHDTDRGLRLTGFVRNAFDKYYWTSAVLGHDTVIRYTGMPRTYGARLTWNF